METAATTYRVYVDLSNKKSQSFEIYSLNMKESAPQFESNLIEAKQKY